jgi:hypothetical protein
MRKLKLESLQVESFETAPAPRERGTMYAHQPPPTKRDCGPDTNADMDCTFGCSTQVYCETEYCETVYCETLGCETNGCETVYCDTSYCG